uniref:C2H2-type domain-containing protein n=1 Tax=Anopheles quadriannulatus TaxID=34691 RepID=A0A182X6Z9_ANOQN
MENPDRVCHFCLEGSDLSALNDEELVVKINRIFYFEVTFPSDTSGLICGRCRQIIEDFYYYAERVARNQEQLRAKLLNRQLKQETLEEIVICPDPSSEARPENSVESVDRKSVPIALTIETVDDVDHQRWGIKEEEHDVHNEENEEEEDEENEDEDDQEYIPPDSRSEQSSPEPETIDELPKTKAKPSAATSSTKKPAAGDASAAKEKETNPSTEQMVLEHYKLSCDICSAPLTDFSDLGKHYRQQHNVTGYLRCCNKKIVKKCWMIEHLQLHLNPDAFRCEQCARSYSSSKVLKEHLKEVHAAAAERSFPCETCRKAFVSRAHLNAHVMVAHGSVSCPQCDKVLASQGSLRKHLVAVHGEGEKHVCEVCARVFRSKQSFDTHRKVHAGNRLESKVQCDLCQAWLMDKYCLTKHVRRMHADQDGEPVACAECGKSFRNQNALNGHMWRAHQESRFECERCHKRFKRPHHMREHIAIHHTGDELYGCKYCSERFNTRNKQLSHRKTAHPEEFAEELRKRTLKE